MAGTILAQLTYGGYISLMKFIPIVVLFYLWIMLINWVFVDTQAVRTKTNFWVGIVITTGVFCSVAWLLIPLYVIGLIIYIITMTTISMVYVMHRNGLVADFERILTAAHLKSILSNDSKKIEKSSKGFTFITANDNPIDIPEPKTRDAFGFQAACDLFNDAIWKRAEIIKLLPSGENYSVTYFIDGVTTNSDPKSKEDVDFLIHYVKQLADLDVNERRKPQKSKFKTKRGTESVEWEVQTAGSTAGEQLLFKKLVAFTEMRIENVGLTEKQVEQIKTLRNNKSGLFLIAGSKGTGVTTAMYAFLKNHDPFLNSINTLEKRPAAEIESITQNFFTMSDTGTSTYDKRLTSILRFGPDIVGVGDCDDAKTAMVAATWASKKMIYVTIDAQNCIEGLAKWIKLVNDKKLATENLVGIASPKLFRVLCDQCREAYQPNPETLRKLNIPANKVEVLYRPGEVQYTRGGKPIICEKCQGTGYYGRTCVFETVVINEQMRDAIKEAKTAQEILSILRKGGMSLMQEEAIKCVVKGELSVNEVVRGLSAPSKNVAK